LCKITYGCIFGGYLFSICWEDEGRVSTIKADKVDREVDLAAVWFGLLIGNAGKF